MKDLAEILAIAREVSWKAADILHSYYHGKFPDTDLQVQYKQNEPVTIADVTVSQYILQRFQAAFGDEDFAYISEETYQSQLHQRNSQLIWIIDPLDGTRDFIDKTGDYAIHIALIQDHRPILAVVAVPELETIYYATKDNGTFKETPKATEPVRLLTAKPIEDLTLVVSRSHRHERLNYLLQNLPCKNQKAVGSVGCKIATILEQKADIYISLSGKSAPKDWDIAAPELILTEAGGNFTHFDGSPLQYNTGDINQWGGLLASNSNYHQVLCQEAQRILSELDSFKKV
ncbi:3'(2'),5'-bisphosphate nucleotidase CysQ [Nostoc sp. LEGE 06077]|uniref:3'(2'),5'-bisphosphate nucleotidase CysQ family protein n=1 Tax=Nostoc sp. LEGE 06077 TaxID=915325 RepID=UPI00187EFA8C|nr:3'(2'),5'-bisphosphate nucleotidase CysQ [Nostoc sp. LEGE 06077]MBE9207014.1 3'(2'),5'-bisphosphate nucleotidase CysQ [Nostoc sp. LEGE 06077]